MRFFCEKDYLVGIIEKTAREARMLEAERSISK